MCCMVLNANGLAFPILRRCIDEALVVGKSFVLEQQLSSCIWGPCDKDPLLRKRFGDRSWQA
jgi:hypothetical protein